MIDILEVLLSSKEKITKREDRFYVTGEEDGKGNIIFHKHYLYNPTRKEKPVAMSVTDFWGTSDSFVKGVYKARFLPKEKMLSEKESRKKLKRLQKYLKASSTSKKTPQKATTANAKVKAIKKTKSTKAKLAKNSKQTQE